MTKGPLGPFPLQFAFNACNNYPVRLISQNEPLLSRRASELAVDLDVHLAAVYLVSLLEGVFASMIWTNRLRGNLWNDAEAMLDAGFDAVRTSAALRRRAQKLPD